VSSIDFQQLARGFRESVGFHWRPPFEVVRLGYESWLYSLPSLCEFAKIPFEGSTIPDARHYTRGIGLDDKSKLDNDDWAGELTLWPGTDDEVRLMRIAIRADYEVNDTFMAARGSAALEAALVRLDQSWKRWRREAELVRTSGGRSIGGAAISWSRLFLDRVQTADILSTIDAFARGEALYAAAGIPWRRGVLFHGPPGNGKTMLCRAIFGHLKWPAVTVTPSGDDDLCDLRRWLDEAEDLAPSILVFEDIDSLITPKLPLSAFLNALDGFEARSGVLLVATTNHPHKLDPAILSRPSRFDRVFEIGPPKLPERERYLAQLFGERLEPERVHKLATDTDGLSMAFLKELFLHAALLGASRGEPKPLELDLAQALDAVKSHLSGAKREFSAARAAGFALGQDEPPPMAEAKSRQG
jgi:hypothetical protein